jgi:hypothetical protein
MRAFVAALFLSASLNWCCADNAPFPQQKFVPFVVLDDGLSNKNVLDLKALSKIKKPLIDAVKISRIKDSMTLKALVDAIGPGYMWATEGVGVVSWSFTDGATLCALPRECKASGIVSFSPKNGEEGMWWMPRPR